MMKVSKTRRVAMVLGLVTVAAVGCKGTWDVDVSINTPVGDATLDIRYDGGKLDVVEVPGDAKADIEFLDENGDPIEPGAQGVGAGDSVQVPAGAKSVAVSGASTHTGACVGCTGMAAPPAHQEDTVFVEKWIQFLPLVPNYSTGGIFGNACFSADVRVPDSYDTYDIFEFVKPILLYGPGYAVPHSAAGFDISIKSFTRFVPNMSSTWPFASPRSHGPKKGNALLKRGGGSGMTVYSMDETSDYDFFDLTLNGSQIADNDVLTSSNYYRAPNGWKVIAIDVPNSVLIYSATSASMLGHIHTRTTEDITVLETSFDLAARE